MITVGIIIMMLGALLFFGMKPKKIGALLAGGGILVLFGSSSSKGMRNGISAITVLGFLAIAAAIVMIVKGVKKGKEINQANAVKAANQKLADFYKECLQNGITECVSEKEIQKATLIAQARGLQFTDIAALFSEAKAASEQATADREAARIEQMKAEEKTAFDELNKYSDLKGRDKRIAILTAERAEALSSAQTLRAGAQAVMSASQQKEHDWAIHGGIASGIAGPAAGLAAAADIQAKNAEIRAQNEANRKAFAPVVMTSYEGAHQAENRAKALLAEIESTKTKLVSDDDAVTCLSKLSFTDTNVEVSETGTCTVTTTAKQASPMIIFDDVEAVIDGTVIAKIYDGTSLVGTAPMVLPKYGVKDSTDLKGMCLYCGKEGRDYTVEYAAVNLWAMER